MNGFKMIAETYKKLGETRTAEIYEFISTCNKDDFCKMVDSSAFNDIIKAFLKKAINDAEIDEKSKDSVMNELKYLFNDTSAKDVLKEYY